MQLSEYKEDVRLIAEIDISSNANNAPREEMMDEASEIRECNYCLSIWNLIISTSIFAAMVISATLYDATNFEELAAVSMVWPMMLVPCGNKEAIIGFVTTVIFTITGMVVLYADKENFVITELILSALWLLCCIALLIRHWRIKRNA